MHDQKVTKTDQVKDIHKDCLLKVERKYESRMKTEFLEGRGVRLEIDFRDGNFKNLSPDILNFYNVDMDANSDLKDESFFVIRRW